MSYETSSNFHSLYVSLKSTFSYEFSPKSTILPQNKCFVRGFHVTKCHACHGICTVSPFDAALTMKFAKNTQHKNDNGSLQSPAPVTQSDFWHVMKHAMSLSATPATRNEVTRRLNPPKVTAFAAVPRGTAVATSHGTTADGCEPLRTVSNDNTLSPQTSGTLATHSGKIKGFVAFPQGSAMPQQNQRIETRHLGSSKRTFRTRPRNFEASVNFHQMSQNAMPATEFARCIHPTQPWQCGLQKHAPRLTLKISENHNGGLQSAAPATKNATRPIFCKPCKRDCHPNDLRYIMKHVGMWQSATPVKRNAVARRLKPSKVTTFATVPRGTAIKNLTRTLPNCCERLRTQTQRLVNTSTSQPPNTQSETGTLATHSAKNMSHPKQWSGNIWTTTGFYRCHIIFWHCVSRRWATWNKCQYQATVAARIGFAKSQNHCIRICMNLYPVELCAFACLGASNHDRPII